jgi:tRNA dimethylallyltransferase
MSAVSAHAAIRSGSPAFVLLGPTASGKSEVAAVLAERLGFDILSADSMAVYRGMDIGTAKPAPDPRRRIRHFGLDLAAPGQPFSAGAYLAAARAELAGRSYAAALPDEADTAPAGRRLLVCGGTGLYVKALLYGLDAAPPRDGSGRVRWQALLREGGVSALRAELNRRRPDLLAGLSDPDNPRRLLRALELADAGAPVPSGWRACAPPPPLPCLRLKPEALRARIARRVDAMFEAGLLDEVRRLRAGCPEWSATARHAIGYAEAIECLDGRCTECEARRRTALRTFRLAKRQRTWFTHQVPVRWIDVDADDDPRRVAGLVAACWREHGPAFLAI